LAKDSVSLVVGLGEVGRPLLQVLSGAHSVQGIDLPPVDARAAVEFMHVCYPGETPDFVGVTAAYAKRYRPDVVVVHSTVPVGTTRAVQAASGLAAVHSPVRGKHIRMAEDLLHYVKFVGAAEPTVAEQVEEHFTAAGMRTKRMSSPEATELAKLAETTYLGLLVAFAQDVDRMARRVGVEYDEAADFFTEIGYLPAGRFFPGVIGGHCVMPNIGLLKRTFESDLLNAIEWSNDLRKAESR